MQYPQIQFYRGSLVRLASGQLKQVEDLSSDDFIESARLAADQRKQAGQPQRAPGRGGLSLSNGGHGQTHQRSRFNFQPLGSSASGPSYLRPCGGSSGTLDENNNSVFNSPEPTSASYDDSPRMEAEEYDVDDDEDDDDGDELDVVTNDDQVRAAGSSRQQPQPMGLNLSAKGAGLGHCASAGELVNPAAGAPKQSCPLEDALLEGDRGSLGDFYVDSSVVRDFLEVGPIQQRQQKQQQQQQQQLSGLLEAPPASCSPASSTGSLGNHQERRAGHSLPATPGASSSLGSLQPPSTSPPAFVPQIMSAAPTTTSQTVLIKFFLETNRSIAFIEVPIEHPFFVLHRGWSSWNPQMTFETFGLKCRKLKIGDNCISLIRRRNKQANSHNDSDQCNILFSSIRINE